MAPLDGIKRSTREFPSTLAGLAVLLAALYASAAVRESDHPPLPVDRVQWVPPAMAPAQAATSGKPLLYVFVEADDEACNLLRQEVFARKGLSDTLNRMFVPVLIQNPDPRSREEALVRKFNVHSHPTFIVCTKNGAWVDGQSRYLGRLIMESWVRSLPDEIAMASLGRRR